MQIRSRSLPNRKHETDATVLLGRDFVYEREKGEFVDDDYGGESTTTKQHFPDAHSRYMHTCNAIHFYEKDASDRANEIRKKNIETLMGSVRDVTNIRAPFVWVLRR